jgi:hypothetical protein
MEYVNGSTKVNGSSVGDGLFGTGLTVSGFDAPGTKVISFRATISSRDKFPLGSVVLDPSIISLTQNVQVNINTIDNVRIIVSNDLPQ